jgi:hypothetical protein
MISTVLVVTLSATTLAASLVTTTVLVEVSSTTTVLEMSVIIQYIQSQGELVRATNNMMHQWNPSQGYRNIHSQEALP